MTQHENKLIVESSTKFDIELMKLWDLYTLGSPGVVGESAEINSAQGFLQRLAQKMQWTKRDRARAKTYMRSLITGANVLDSFVIVPIKLIVNSVERNILDSDGEEKIAWEGVKAYVDKVKAEGAKFFIIDGQNRLFESIVPFFNSEFALGEESLVFKDEKGNRSSISSLTYNQICEQFSTSGIDDYIKNIEVPVVSATSGDIEQLSNVLIWKNEGVSWDDWQKGITKNWYTKFRRQLSSVTCVDTGDEHSRNVFNRVTASKYSYDTNGHDLFTAELLIWMDSKRQMKDIETVKEYFQGVHVIKDSQVRKLKTYLKEMDQAYDNTTLTNTEIRNYVMLRYAIDTRSEFKTVNVPCWKVHKGVNFAGVFKVVNKNLMKTPRASFEEKDNYAVYSTDYGEKPVKVPGSYMHNNANTDQKDLEGRLCILFRVLTDEKGMLGTLKDDLWKDNTITNYDTSAMPSIEEVYIANPKDNKGNKIPISKLKSKNYDRGHIKTSPRNRGGLNSSVQLENVRENRQTGNDAKIV